MFTSQLQWQADESTGINYSKLACENNFIQMSQIKPLNESVVFMFCNIFLFIFLFCCHKHYVKSMWVAEKKKQVLQMTQQDSKNRPAISMHYYSQVNDSSWISEMCAFNQSVFFQCSNVQCICCFIFQQFLLGVTWLDWDWTGTYFWIFSFLKHRHSLV